MDQIFDQSNQGDKKYHTNFTNATVRKNFIKKVYGILSIQLLVTTIFCYFSVTSRAFLLFQISHNMLFNTCITLAVAIPIILMCFKNLAHQVPKNYVLLTLFTLSEAYVVSHTCGMIQDPSLVLMAGFLTLGITFSLTLYAMITKEDFTTYGSFLIVILTSISLVGLICLFTNSQILYMIYLLGGVIIYGIYLIYDTQLIVGGKRCEIGIDDYIIGSVLIYVDIVVLFLKILDILQKLKNNDDDEDKKERKK